MTEQMQAVAAIRAAIGEDVLTFVPQERDHHGFEVIGDRMARFEVSRHGEATFYSAGDVPELIDWRDGVPKSCAAAVRARGRMVRRAMRTGKARHWTARIVGAILDRLAGGRRP